MYIPINVLAYLQVVVCTLQHETSNTTNRHQTAIVIRLTMTQRRLACINIHDILDSSRIMTHWG